MIRKALVTLLVLAVPALLVAADAKPYTKNVAIVIYNGVEILDWTGPAEVFAAAGSFGASESKNAFNVYTVSRAKDPIVSQGFIDILPDYSIADAPKPDIIVLPGGNSTNVTKDAEWMEWVKSSAKDADHVLTVCTGAFIAGRAGYLEGIEATTWYNAVPGLTKEFANTRVIPGRRFIDSGKMITTAGVSAGIDGSLHVVARLLGRYVADRTAEYMEYKWSPESYMSSKYAQLNPQLDERGRTLQQASIYRREGNDSAAISTYRALVAADRNDSEAWLQLGKVFHNQKNYKEAMAANLEAMKGSAQRGNALYNLACEYALLGQRDKAIETAEKAIEAGFKFKPFYESDSDLDSIRNDARFKVLLTKL